MADPTTNVTTNDDDIADADLIDPASVIEPPPEMKTIIEKTVSFVVKNGIGFESKVRDSQRSNRKFDFLNTGHAFHSYYKQKYQIAKYPKAAALAERYREQKEALHNSQQQLLGINDGKNGEKLREIKNKKSLRGKSNVISHKLTLSQRIKQQLALSKVAKSEYIVERKGYNKFVVPLPTKRNISSYEIDVIKLVAQFTAVHGKSFIRDLQRGEPENETFGFLSPMHPRFQYFQRLIDAYCSIIDEFDDYRESKRRNKRKRDRLHLDRDKIWSQVIGCAEFTNREKEKEAKYLKDEENERRANALIDWQSFTVLDTIDFDGDDDGTHLVPPGATIEEIDAILESTHDVEADINDVVLAHDEEQDMDISQSDDDDEEEMAMEQVVENNKKNIMIPIEMESEASELHKKQVAKAKMAVKMKSAPMPAPKGVIISSDLDIVPSQKMETEQDIELRLKLEKILTDSRNEQFENQQCPICNEFINIAHLSQHIRIELLDPKWKEQKESLKLKLSQTTLASNEQISENLIKFNKHQHIENMNGNERNQKKKKREKTQTEEIEKEKEDREKKENNEKQQETVEKQQKTREPPPPQPQHPPITRPMAPFMGGAPPPFAHHFAHHPAHRMPPQMIPPPHHPMHHHHVHPHHPHAMMPPPPAPVRRPPFNMQPHHGMNIVQPPPAKKMKLNHAAAGKQPDGLIEEQLFLQQNGGTSTQHKIRIIVPKDESKKQFKFNGQTLTFTMQLNQTINQLKQRINAVLALPPNKQKLRCKANGIWVKDANSLAFYNINAQSVLELATRTRGGKKNKQ